MIKQGKIIKVPNPMMNAELRKCGHKVVPDKKKQADKKACRGQLCRATI